MTDPITRWREVAAESERATECGIVHLTDRNGQIIDHVEHDPSDLGRMTQVWGDYHDKRRLPSGWWIVPLSIGGGMAWAVFILWIVGVL